jgi:hypothetical protein
MGFYPDILHLIRGVPHHLPGPIRSITWCHGPAIPAHRGRCAHCARDLLHMEPVPAAGAGAGASVDAERRIQPGSPSCDRGSRIRDFAPVARILGSSGRFRGCPFLGWHRLWNRFPAHLHRHAKLPD